MFCVLKQDQGPTISKAYKLLISNVYLIPCEHAVKWTSIMSQLLNNEMSGGIMLSWCFNNCWIATLPQHSSYAKTSGFPILLPPCDQPNILCYKLIITSKSWILHNPKDCLRAKTQTCMGRASQNGWNVSCRDWNAAIIFEQPVTSRAKLLIHIFWYLLTPC